jgi:hypothetical protein
MDITSRDRFIIGNALLYTIKYVDSLPEHLREQSERNDLVRLLKMLCPKTIEKVRSARGSWAVDIPSETMPTASAAWRHVDLRGIAVISQFSEQNLSCCDR